MSALLALPRCAPAQAPQTPAPLEGAISITGGSSTTLLGTTARGLTVAPSLTFTPDPKTLFGAGASATQYDDHQWAFGADASTALRLPLASIVALTLNGGADMTKTSYQFAYATARALPAIEAHADGLAVYAGVQAASATTWRAITTAGLPGGLFGDATPASQSTVTTAHAALGGVLGGTMTFATGPHETVQIGAREERTRIDTLHVIDRSGSLALTSGPVVATFTMGMHLEPANRSLFGNGALSYAVTPVLAVNVAAGSYPIDHLLDAPAGHYLDLGLSIRLGRSVRPMSASPTTFTVSPRQPTVHAAGVAEPEPGFTRLAIRAPEAHHVELAGDFTTWKLIPTERAANGVWYVDLRIPPGRYRYAFRVDGTTWTIPDGAAEVHDDLGGHSAWLDVSDGNEVPLTNEPRSHPSKP